MTANVEPRGTSTLGLFFKEETFVVLGGIEDYNRNGFYPHLPLWIEICAKVCTEAVHSVVTLWTRTLSGLDMCKVCAEAVHSVALWTRTLSQVWTCVKYVPKQSHSVALWTRKLSGLDMCKVCSDGERSIRQTYINIATKNERQNCSLAVFFDGERRALRVNFEWFQLAWFPWELMLKMMVFGQQNWLPFCRKSMEK